MSKLKVCPFCAEDIKIAAIVCKHCGRDLPGYKNDLEKLKEKNDVIDIKISQTKNETEYTKTPLKKSVSFALIATVIGFIVNFSNSYNPITKEFPAERLGNMIISLPLLFFFWLIIGTIVVWLYRKIGKRNSIVISVVIAIIPIIFIIYYSFDNSTSQYSVNDNHTSTPGQNIQGPGAIYADGRKTQIAENEDLSEICIHFSEVTDLLLNKSICIYGEVVYQAYNVESGEGYVKFSNLNLSKTEFRFYYTAETAGNNIIGECLEMRGKLQLLNKNYRNMFTLLPRESAKASLECN